MTDDLEILLRLTTLRDDSRRIQKLIAESNQTRGGDQARNFLDTAGVLITEAAKALQTKGFNFQGRVMSVNTSN